LLHPIERVPVGLLAFAGSAFVFADHQAYLMGFLFLVGPSFDLVNNPTRVGRFSSRPNRRAHAHGMGEPKLNAKSSEAATAYLLAGYLVIVFAVISGAAFVLNFSLMIYFKENLPA
jgi:hypothetical protein